MELHIAGFSFSPSHQMLCAQQPTGQRHQASLPRRRCSCCLQMASGFDSPDTVALSVCLAEHGITSVRDIVTDVVDSRCLWISRASDGSRIMELQFPCAVNDATCSAKYSRKTSVLTISAAPQHAPDADERHVEGSAPGHTCRGTGTQPAEPDDATLLKEFADEAYLMSLQLNSGPPPPPLHPAGAGESPSNLAPQQALHSSSIVPASKPASTTTAASRTPSASTASASAGAKLQPTNSTAGPVPEQHVPLGVGLDCSHLAAAFGCSFGLGFKTKNGSSRHAKKEERRQATATLKALADQLHSKGWAACDDYIPADVVAAVRTEIKQMQGHYTPGEIWVGKEADLGAQVRVPDVRGDIVLWMDEQALAATAFIKDGKKQSCSFYTLQQVVKAVDQLVVHELPRHVSECANLADGGRSDAMLAIYPGSGARFAKHIDNSADDGRRLTCLCYLNNNWREQDGGALRLFAPGQDPVDVLPLGGRIALFWSKTVAHEVRPAYKQRHSFTLWYYDSNERAAALAKARVGNTGSAAAQAQAQALIRDILAQDVIKPTDEGCAIVAQRIKAMTTGALTIIAGVVGATNVQDFVQAACNLNPSSLAALRDEISHMGLQSHAPTV